MIEIFLFVFSAAAAFLAAGAFFAAVLFLATEAFLAAGAFLAVFLTAMLFLAAGALLAAGAFAAAFLAACTGMPVRMRCDSVPPAKAITQLRRAARATPTSKRRAVARGLRGAAISLSDYCSALYESVAVGK